MPQQGNSFRVQGSQDYTIGPTSTLTIQGAIVGMNTGGIRVYCDPNRGSDNNSGLSPSQAKQTLLAAHALTTANQNDIVYLIGTANAASSTTARVASGGLAWDKDNVHLIGINSGNVVQSRSRISPETTDVTTETVLNITADNCLFSNFSVFHGVNGWTGSGGVPTAVKVNGQRNRFENVSFSGLGDATGANSMDVTNGASLWLSDSENVFENCYIGLETVFLGDTSAGAIRVTGAVSRNIFKSCIISTRSSHGNHAPVNVAASGLQDTGLVFSDCIFTNSGIFTGGTASDEVFDVNATQNGGVWVSNCSAFGFSFWEVAAVSGKVYVDNPAVGAGKTGLATVVVGS